MSNRTDYWTWLSCFLAGAIAGAGTALLLAPESGRDTRGRMGRRLRRAARAARELKHRVAEPDSVRAGNGGHRETSREGVVPSI